MTDDALILVGRDAIRDTDVLETHARRLERRGIADTVATATYGTEPVRDLRERFAGVDADRTYVVPMCVGHTRATTTDLPAALSYLPGDVRYCEPVGRSPAVTSLLLRRASALVPPAPDATLVLVGFGSGSQPYQRQAAEYHAARVREGSAYGEVLTCYLVQNPAAECVRYNVSSDRAVAVPLFLARCETTETEIPAKLELDRGGIEYADPLGDHRLVTDAVHGEVAKQRALAGHGDAPAADHGDARAVGRGDAPAGDGEGQGLPGESFEASLARGRRPVATDGEGGRR